MNNTCGDRDCFSCYPDDPSILAENQRLREALEKIAKLENWMYDGWHWCWNGLGEAHEVAQEALKKIGA